jgi:hydrogenase nickel incorporation protein HypA/HybF
MHELALCEALTGQVERVAREAGAVRVLSVTLRVGPLSGIEPALLESAFPLSSAGTMLERSKLLIERSPIRVRCLECGQESEALPTRLLCARCAHWRVQVLSGQELMLARVELERPGRD